MNSSENKLTENRLSLAERAMSLAPKRHLESLNPAQRSAVETLQGPLLMLAGAGTGKTRALTARIAHLIMTNTARSNEILAVTFTNKAAREMKNRVSTMLGHSVEGMPWLGTFHSICVKLLRRHAELIGLDRKGDIIAGLDTTASLKSNFTILDSSDQERLLRQVLSLANIDSKVLPVRSLAAAIDRWKNRALTPQKISPGERGHFDGRAVELYKMYQRRLIELNAVDFDDLILHIVLIFQTNEKILSKYQQWFRYILVDEYQDTNVAQYLWLRLLAEKHQNICCVGDDDQAIYRWRGAEVENILRFEKAFPTCNIIRLEQNYRSTPHILAAASAIISNNKSRLGKDLWTSDNYGEKVRLIGHFRDQDEARWLGDEIEALCTGSGGLKPFRLNDIAILVRATFQMRVIEDRFFAIGIPYRIIGGLRFYERIEIRDAIAYFRIVTSPSDDLAFERIVNTPRRGIGDKTRQIIFKAARSNSLSLIEGSQFAVKNGQIKGKAAVELQLLSDKIRQWRDMMHNDKVSHAELAELILDESGYTTMWQAEKTPEAPGRLENLKELTKSISDFDNLQGFLEHISLMIANDTDMESDKVTLMTLHAAKGLEFPCIFLPGWEEEVFPSKRTEEENGTAGVEEERRLAYVGITRAQEVCTISFAESRFAFGKVQMQFPSRFINELPEEHVDILTSMTGSYRNDSRQDMQGSTIEEQSAYAGTYHSAGWKRFQSRSKAVRKLSPPQFTKKETNNMSKGKFALGDRVFHMKYGYGSIKSVDINTLEIEFEKADMKRVDVRYVHHMNDIPE
ncbi:MAG: UvrD-helicase domain-containing protein [Aestuariivita sp.]|nr:UvrD-helicase domain-containing protein [Aestuariivita sp.]